MASEDKAKDVYKDVQKVRSNIQRRENIGKGVRKNIEERKAHEEKGKDKK